MTTQIGLLRQFHALERRRGDTEEARRDEARRRLDVFEDVVMNKRWDHIPRHLVSFPSGNGQDPAFAVIRYLGRVGSSEYFLYVLESSVEPRRFWDARLFVARASRSRPARVKAVPIEDVNETLITRLLGAVARTVRQKQPFFRIPRGYYPYGYFANWVSERWGRRKHHTSHHSGVLQGRTARDAYRKLIRQFGPYNSIDSLHVLTSGGYRHLDLRLDGKHVGTITPAFLRRGTLRVYRRHRAA